MTLFQLIVLYFAIVVHEVSHGAMAYKLGDPTAKSLGRLTFNPLKHIDPFGTVILPLFLFLIRSPFIVGYAKPVPFNPANFKDVRKGTMLTALAGPLANFSLALIFCLLVRIFVYFGFLSANLLSLFMVIIFINFLLAFFNLAPFYPFDGHHIFLSLLPDRFYKLKEFVVRNGLFLSIIWIFFIFQLFIPLIVELTEVLTGAPLTIF